MENVGVVIRGLFIGYKERFREGKPDGYNVAIACGVDSYKVKVSAEMFEQAQIAAGALGDLIEAAVSINSFRERLYFSAESIGFIS